MIDLVWGFIFIGINSMNTNLCLAIQFVLNAFTSQDVVGDALDLRYIITNSNRYRLPDSSQEQIDEAVQYCIEQGYLTQDHRLTEKGYQAIR